MVAPQSPQRRAASGGEDAPTPSRTPPLLALLPLALLLLRTAFPSTPTTNDASTLCAVPPVPPLQPPHRIANLTHARPTVYLTDGSNFDDILTLIYLLKTPHLTPVAVYIGGNAWANAAPSRRVFRDLLTLFGAPYARTPILVGSFFALADEAAAHDDGLPHVVTPRYRAPVPHGRAGILRCDDAFGTARHLPAAAPGADDDAAEDDVAALHTLARLLEGFADGEVLFLATGTLTPVAKVLAATEHENAAIASAAKNVLGKLGDFVMMGGAVHARGNVYTLPSNNHAEFNVFNDPHAADLSLRGLVSHGKRVMVVPLDATSDVPFTPDFCTSLESARDTATTERARTPELQYAGLLVQRLRQSWEGEASFFDAAFLWDVTAAVVAAVPAVVSNASTVHMRVVTEQDVLGAQQGWTKACEPAEMETDMCYPVRVVFGVDGAAVRDEVLERLRSGVNSATRSLVCG